ncbi:MAG: multicopper oxidase domain-containing protein [Gemmatimonadaceae bacterium]
MLTSVSSRAALLLALVFLTGSGFSDDTVTTALPVVEANDNRKPAGVLKNDTLSIGLVVQMARWYPEEADGPFAEVAAFAEEGKAPQIPGPLIRVSEGTMIVATVRNTLPDSTVWVRSMVTRPAAGPDSVPVKPGETKTFRFMAGAPGTYLYYATPGTVNNEIREREQLSGAFVVDPRGKPADDRILMISIWGEPVDSTGYRNAVAINGKSWPHTERMTAEVGDSVKWRVINASIRPHPMHLHGFYFRVDSRGTHLADTALSAEARRLVVTENMTPGTTMNITWSPDRPGNWLFHCHLVFHVLEGARLDSHREEHGHATNLMKHMAGLVTGIIVSDPKGLARGSTGEVRKLRLVATERPRQGRTPLHMSYVLQRDARMPAADSVEAPGQMIVLIRNEPTEVTIVNKSHAGTSVHWHGIELESYSDGVAGWSGADMKVAPMIAPKDSFIARLTLPRAGTFIYHTHLNDVEQLTSGMYGPVIVLEPGEKFDPETDHVFTLGWDGAGEPPGIVLNGDTTGGVPLEMKLGATHRLRFINIGAAGGMTFAVRKDSLPVMWRPRAKDGADLPDGLRGEKVAVRRIYTGETFDADWKPAEAGEYILTVGRRQPWVYSRKVVVR